MKYGLALIGFGGVNRALVEILKTKQDLLKTKYDIELKIVSVSDKFFGYASDEEGLDFDALISLPSEEGALMSLPNGQTDADNLRAINNYSANIIVEATYTNPVDAEPAITHCREALSNKKHVITTNKGPVALFGKSLTKMAQDNGVCFEYEGSVMSGTPVICHVEKNLKACDIRKISGILNGTANYVLTQVEAGSSIAAAIKNAQEMGYAEADPTADIEGYDVMLKVVILANQLLGLDLKPSDVERQGIESLSEVQIQEAADNGKHYKLIGQVVNNMDGSFSASVAPECLDKDNILSGISGATNAVAFDTDMLGTTMVSGSGAGRIETAYALLSDILNIHEKQS